MSTRMAQPKVCIISLDGATFDILNPLVERGLMPNIGRLMQQGAAMPLESTIPPITPVAWTSFMTGKNPGKHTILDFRCYDPATQADKFVNSTHIRGETLWQILSRHGRRSCVINLPLTYPPYPINGCLVSGFDTPSVASAFTFPAELKAEILERIPDYDFILSWGFQDWNVANAFETYLDCITRAFEQRAEVAMRLMAREAWDVFMVHFQNLDNLQHKFWAPPNSIEAESLGPERCRHVWACYNRLDALVGQLLAQPWAKDALQLIISDHGFGPYHGKIYVNQLLHDWGYLALPPEITPARPRNGHTKPQQANQPGWFYRIRQAAGSSDQPIVKELVKAGRAVKRQLAPANGRPSLPAAPRRSSPDWIADARQRDLAAELLADWTQSAAFAVLAELHCFVQVNLRGREPHGVVAPGAEYENLLAELKHRFESALDPRDGQPLFVSVRRSREVFDSQPGDQFPDLVLEPRPGFSTLRSLADDGAIVQYLTPGGGTHRPYGILVAHGPGVAAPTSAVGAQLIDLAPMILTYLGLPVPVDMDGVLPPGLIAQELQRENSPNIGAGIFEPETAVYDEAEAQLIEERLRGLGYLE